jgi:hypothetical protein
MTVLQKFYLIFVRERHFCGVSPGGPGNPSISIGFYTLRVVNFDSDEKSKLTTLTVIEL